MKDLKKNSRLEEIRRTIPQETKREVEKLHAIADRIFELLKQKGLDQRNLAKSLGKYESEVSKWMAGEHNFTIQSILKLEAVLGGEIIQIPKKKEETELYWIKSRVEKLKALSAELQSTNCLSPETEKLSVVNEPRCKNWSDIEFSFYTIQNLSNEGNWKDKEEFEQTKTV
jgi:transcriptional regulator with XRE-family HTH domain